MPIVITQLGLRPRRVQRWVRRLAPALLRCFAFREIRFGAAMPYYCNKTTMAAAEAVNKPFLEEETSHDPDGEMPNRVPHIYLVFHHYLLTKSVLGKPALLNSTARSPPRFGSPHYQPPASDGATCPNASRSGGVIIRNAEVAALPDQFTVGPDSAKQTSGRQ